MSDGGEAHRFDTSALTRGIARGEARAITVLYEAWFERSVAIVRAFTRRDESFALDVVQEALLRAIRTMRPIDGDEELRRLIVRILRTTAIDFLRRECRQMRAESKASARRARDSSGQKEEAAELEVEERLRWLEARVAELAPDDRTLLLRRFEAGFTLRDAAEPLGLSPSAASRRLALLVEKLRRSARRFFGELA